MTKKTNTIRYAIAATIITLLAAVHQPNAADIRSHWKPGEVRTYEFKIGLQSLGTHTAKFVGMEDLPGFGSTCLFEMDVNLDMRSVGFDVKTERACSLYYDLRGFPNRYVARYDNDGREGWIDAVVQQHVFRGFTRGLGADSSFAIDIPPGSYLCDNNFVAQWQMVFADLDLNPGDTHTVDILIPEDVNRISVKVVVTGYEPVAVDTAKVMCTVARVDRINHRFYVAPDGRLVRAVEPRQGLVIDLVQTQEGRVAEIPTEKGARFWRTLPRRAVIWLIYGAWSFIILIALARNGLRRLDFWLLFAVTGATFGLVILIQAPVMREAAKSIFRVVGTSGAGIYVGALAAAVISGMFQEGLKTLPIYFNWNRFEQKPNLGLMLSLGAAAGIGFGFVEACWLTGGAFAAGHVGLVSIITYERFVTVLFHAGSGILLGYGIGRRQVWQYWLLVSALHAVANFSVVFMRQGLVDAVILMLFITLFDIAVLGYAVAILKKIQRR